MEHKIKLGIIICDRYKSCAGGKPYGRGGLGNHHGGGKGKGQGRGFRNR